MAPSSRRTAERQYADQPADGDLQTCPFCRAGSMIFREQQRFDDGVMPAWVCDNPDCGYRARFRKPQQRSSSKSAASKARTRNKQGG